MGVVVDTILTFPDPALSTVSAIPAGRTPALTHAGIWTILPNGLIAAGFSDRFQVELRTFSGDLVRVLTRGKEPAPLTRQKQERFLERLLDLWAEMFRARGESESSIADQLREGRRIYALPEYAPAFTALAVGPEGTLWIQRALPVDSMTGAILQGQALRAFAGPEWEIYSSEDRLIGLAILPPGFTLLKIHGDHIYGKQRGEFDLQRVVRLRIGVP
jgi:hypothetical protein